MGAIGERKLQELIDKDAADVARGTPPDIASRGLFEACAEVLEGKEVLEQERDEFAKKNAEYGKAVADLRVHVKELLDKDIGHGDPEPGDILDAYKTLAQEIDELRGAEKTLSARNKALEEEIEQKQRALDAGHERIRDLQQALEAAEARLRELEPAGEERAALVERVRYLESGLGRIVVDAYKLRKGAL